LAVGVSVQFVEVTQQRITVLMDSDFAGGHVGVDVPFTLLPPVGPEPSLICGNREGWSEFQHAVLALGEFHLGAWFVEMQASSYLRRECDDASGLHCYVPVKSHTASSHTWRHYVNAVLLQYRIAVPIIHG